jgi:hypothetical protein
MTDAARCFLVNYEATINPATITTNSNPLKPEAQNGIFSITYPPAASHGLAAANGFTATPDPLVAKPGNIRNSTTTTGVLSEITGESMPSASPSSSRSGPAQLPDDPMTTTSVQLRLRTWAGSGWPTRVMTPRILPAELARVSVWRHSGVRTREAHTATLRRR